MIGTIAAWTFVCAVALWLTLLSFSCLRMWQTIDAINASLNTIERKEEHTWDELQRRVP